MIPAPRTTEAYRASMKMLDDLKVWCRCATPTGMRTQHTSPYGAITFCKACQGLIKPDADETEVNHSQGAP